MPAISQSISIQLAQFTLEMPNTLYKEVLNSMSIGLGVWAFVVYLAMVILWSTLCKRSITEAMMLGFLVVPFFGGLENYAKTIADSFYAAATDDIFVATMMFVFMSAIMTKTGIIAELIEILNSLIGRLRRGAGWNSPLRNGNKGLCLR